MQEFNKFRVITVGFILMFIFVISAMYTNTKDITNQKTKKTEIDKSQKEEYNYKRRVDNSEVDDTGARFDILNRRIDRLESDFRELHDGSAKGLNCQIRGILSDSDVVPLSADEAIEEARLNNREIVVTCNLN